MKALLLVILLMIATNVPAFEPESLPVLLQKTYFPSFAQGFVALQGDRLSLRSQEGGLTLDKNGILTNVEKTKHFQYATTPQGAHHFISAAKVSGRFWLNRPDKNTFKQEIKNLKVNKNGDLMDVSFCEGEVWEASGLGRKVKNQFACVQVDQSICKEYDKQKQKLESEPFGKAQAAVIQELVKKVEDKNNFINMANLFQLGSITHVNSPNPVISINSGFNDGGETEDLESAMSYVERFKSACGLVYQYQMSKKNYEVLSKTEKPERTKAEEDAYCNTPQPCAEDYKWESGFCKCMKDADAMWNKSKPLSIEPLEIPVTPKAPIPSHNSKNKKAR